MVAFILNTCEWTFTGKPGIGCTMTWNGPDLGQGKLEINTAQPGAGITYTMTMDGMKALRGSLSFAADESNTRVTWKDDIDVGSNPLSRWMSLLMLEDLLGSEFEKGLANLKTRAERREAGPVEASGDKK